MTDLRSPVRRLACVSPGGGNAYARQGQVREWLIEQDEYAKMKARGQCDCDCD